MESGVFSADGKTLVAGTHGSARNWRRQEQIAEQDANARLIAAAPELLAALMGLRLYVDPMMGGEEVDNAIRAANAAIAKAKGETP
jgi:hypothetical protein